MREDMIRELHQEQSFEKKEEYLFKEKHAKETSRGTII